MKSKKSKLSLKRKARRAFLRSKTEEPPTSRDAEILCAQLERHYGPDPLLKEWRTKEEMVPLLESVLNRTTSFRLAAALWSHKQSAPLKMSTEEAVKYARVGQIPTELVLTISPLHAYPIVQRHCICLYSPYLDGKNMRICLSTGKRHYIQRSTEPVYMIVEEKGPLTANMQSWPASYRIAYLKMLLRERSASDLLYSGPVEANFFHKLRTINMHPSKKQRANSMGLQIARGVAEYERTS